MEFLDKNYERPTDVGNYTKLEDGENRIRILDSAIVGWEYWVEETTNDGKQTRKPIRTKELKKVPKEYYSDAKHFWSFPVYNYKAKRIQILNLTQSGIQKNIEAIVRNPKWGDPKEYDIVITRTKTGTEKWDVEYYVQPDPKEKLEEGVEQLYKDMDIKIEKLYTSGDPFEASSEDFNKKVENRTKEDNIDIDEVSEALEKE